jgi:hypothetical protein
MTITVSTNSVTWLGNGATTVFSYTFAMPSAADATLLYTTAAGVQTTVAPGAYGLTGVGQPTAGGGPQGGTVTYAPGGVPIPAGSSLTFFRTVPLTQPTELSNQGGVWPSVVEASDDSLEMQIQQLAWALGRALLFNPADVGPFATFPPAAQRALGLLGFDSLGNPIVALSSIGALVSSAMAPVVAASSLAQALTALGISPAMQPALGAASTALALTALGIPPVMQPVVEAGSLNTAVNLLSVGATTSALPLTPYMFGAVGNGIADDTTAMNAWYAALTSSGRRGYLPAGTFLCPSGLVWDLALVQRSCLIIDGAGPNLAIINVTGAAGVGLQIQDTGSGGAAFYTKFTNFSVAGSNSAGPVFAVMRFNGGDALNGGEISNVVVNNASTASGAIGIQVNECATCFFNMTTNTAGHGTALQIAGACGFCCFQGSYSGSHIAVWITNNSYCFSNTFISNDYEVVDINVQCDSPNAARNTWIGGQFDSVTGPLHGGAGSATFNCTAGSNHIFINPNIDAFPAQMFLSGGYVGVKIIGSGNDLPPTPSVPSSGTPMTNATGYTVDVIIYNGVVTYVAINGATITISSGCAGNAGSFTVQPGDVITLTYSTAPVWLWKPIY